MGLCDVVVVSFFCGIFGLAGNVTTQAKMTCVPDEGFDFIIVGSGATGSVIANRLSELEDIKVLVLEAGEEPLHISNIPLIAFKALRTEMDWSYMSTSQKHCCTAFKNQQVPLSRGKCLGGTTSLNFMTYTRGNRRDYDLWKELGNEGWGYDDLFPYFMKLEGYRPYMTREDEKYHNKSGPMTVEIPPYKSLMAEAFLQASYEMGLPLVDYNGKDQIGVMYPPVTLRDGERCSTYRAYLKPAMKRSNLVVASNALVTKILFDDTKKRAIGVTYELKDKQVCTVKAKREVIVSGGTYNSPQLLLLSGIGPKEHLDELKIPVVLDLPGVGQNLQDHMVLGGMMYKIDQPVGINSVRLETKEYEDLWERTKTGPMTVPVSFEGVSFHKTKATQGPDDWPDVEMFFNTDNSVRIYKPMLVQSAASIIPPDDVDVVSLHPILLRPKSRGWVKLQSTNPRDAPLINPNYLEHKDDVDVMAEAVAIIQKFGEMKAFKQYGARLVRDGIFMDCITSIFLGMQNYRRCFARTFSSTGYHPTSTCKMGPASDKMAVVDNKLRVHGIKGLRVADASIMPNVPAAHTQVPCMAIGEKVSDIIKEDIQASRKN